MIIGGFLPFSSIDYPGRISSVLFTQGCNCRCPFCHNSELVAIKKEGVETVDEIIETLKKRKKLIDSVVVSGGEPTIHDDLIDFMVLLKRNHFAVKLDTNGSNPGMIAGIAEMKCVDFVSIDVKSSPEKYFKAVNAGFNFDGILEIVKTLDAAGICYELRTTVVPGLVEEEDMNKISSILGGDRDLVLQQFVPDKTLDPEFKNLKPHDYEIVEKMIKIARSRFARVNSRGFI
ncbi:anaerobic ribonucleoside-triphosphate reductase activating protein [candidate division WOR-3 bacterium]|nr:anaerobic ribonucleoside-triphosphate reductase activating protein [candidate division WOR-3 bacterium]